MVAGKWWKVLSSNTLHALERSADLCQQKVADCVVRRITPILNSIEDPFRKVSDNYHKNLATVDFVFTFS